MPAFVLDAFGDSAKWRMFLERFPEPCRDVYFTPEYVRLHLFESGSHALFFAYQERENIWAYPFILRPLVQIGDVVLERQWSDIESAYGYGGPLCTTDDFGFVEAANAAFASWCAEKNVVAEFVRLHPLLGGQRWLARDVKVLADRETVSLNLRCFSTSATLFSSTTRNMLRRAERAGVRIAAYPASVAFDRFSQLYRLTMRRLGATDYYYFSDQYFSGLQQLVQEKGWLYAATIGDEWISAALFLKGQQWVHYHLSGSHPDRRVPGATNQVIYAAAQIAAKEGFERLHLGGGRTTQPGDSLLEFKRTMSTDSHQFRIGRRIHNPEAFTELREIWAQQFPRLVSKYGGRLLCYRQSE